jgi:hypothetical protein
VLLTLSKSGAFERGQVAFFGPLSNERIRTFNILLSPPAATAFTLSRDSFVIAASSASPTQSCHKKISLYSYIEGVPEVFANFVRLYIHKSKDLALVPNWRSHSEVFDRLFKRLILTIF